ncbi:hypothetical protein SAMN05660776_1082 [Salegentibacter holothuriorum]|uniref:Secreted protein n=1 Tax=Salegentibacter holothuriorum TaxID=241145 RepID=A0A1T5BD47_9FLAO|nr:hypothetical protein [Salegentibacter holothuriorum]SKB44939.1 hypothetical protein SAMN05660776_1082 [Salegentibacter holothuriorum]
MKKASQHSISVAMAFLVLFSTFSFTVDKHFCGSFLVDTAIFSEAQTCGMDMEASAQDSCCSNEKLAIEGQDELKHKFDSLDLNQQVFLIGFAYSYIFILEDNPKEIVPFKYYTPPLLVKDIQLEDQVFLI